MSIRYKATLPDAEYWAGRIPCQMACPVRTDAGRYVQLIAEGRFEEAYLTARSPNPLASVCGRICAAPCEDKCRRGLFDAPVSIRALKRVVTERFGVESREPQTQQQLHEGTFEPGNKWRWHLPKLESQLLGVGHGKPVAVVGAGPAGLACAHDLALMGYRVTLFEGSARAGGMAVHGIPEFRLPRSVIDKEIGVIAGMGVEFRFSTPITPEHGLAWLKAEGYEAVFISVGLQQGRGLNCPGSDKDGVIRAIDYLININNGYRVPQASKVLVVGGGFTAFDAARMALRASATEAPESGEVGSVMNTALDAARIAVRAGAQVTLASLESYAEMPVLRTEQGREEFEEALREGIQFKPQRGVARLLGNGSVNAAELVGVKRTYDDTGRFAPEYDEGLKEQLDADLVILAIGQQADLSFITPADNVATARGGIIQVDPTTLATTAAWVFAGGDVAFGPRNLIEGVADGKRAALGIDAHLRGAVDKPQWRFRFEKIPTRSFERTKEYELVPRQAPPTHDMGRRTGISEVEAVYGEAEAVTQAQRCLACHIQTIYDPAKCVLCNRCVDVCPESCLKLVPIEQVGFEPDHLEQAKRQAGVDGTGLLSVMLKDDERCIRCGLCAVRCPTDAMTMEVLYYEQV
jgi:formate dehydrogenase (NADP+) beta subunit